MLPRTLQAKEEEEKRNEEKKNVTGKRKCGV